MREFEERMKAEAAAEAEEAESVSMTTPEEDVVYEASAAAEFAEFAAGEPEIVEYDE